MYLGGKGPLCNVFVTGHSSHDDAMMTSQALHSDLYVTSTGNEDPIDVVGLDLHEARMMAV